jgi:hypothetical protein
MTSYKEKEVESSDVQEEPVKRKRGRPRKSELIPTKRGRGRPKGDHSAMIEMKQRFLARRDTDAVINSIYRAAMDDDHKNQAAAWKLIVDRVLPVSAFDKDKMGGRPTVNITISGVTDMPSIEGEVIDHEELD